MSTKVTRINQIAIEKPNEVFTSIYHLINFELLKECFDELDGKKCHDLLVNKFINLYHLILEKD